MKVRILTVGTVSVGVKDVPALRISGDWLAKVGFCRGKKFIIQERSGQLTLQLVTLEEGTPCE
jgi:hypothetical protein